MKFDDLFGEFFNGPQKDPLKDEISRIMKSLMGFKKISNSEDEIYDKLGEPDEIIKGEQDGVIFEKQIWHRDGGHYVRLVFENTTPETPVPETPVPEAPKLSLEEQLQNAVDLEDWDLAIQLRDKINSKKVE